MTQIDSRKDISRSTIRRLLLAKQLYMHGLDHSLKDGALNKMIGIHNFHNAIEISLRAIFLQYEIRPEKQLNIEFEVMLNEIDNFPGFKKSDIRLPYRQELRNLNQLRNLVQHHVMEPETSTMEDWRVFTKRFLINSFDTYFEVSFDRVSAIDMIHDEILINLMTLSKKKYIEEDYSQSIAYAVVAFDVAQNTLMKLLPKPQIRPASFSNHSGRSLSDAVNFGFDKAIEYSIVLSSGVSITNYRKFLITRNQVHFDLYGDVPRIEKDIKIDPDDAEWIVNFVIETIVNWQTLGLVPETSEYEEDRVKILITEGFKYFLTHKEIIEREFGNRKD